MNWICCLIFTGRWCPDNGLFRNDVYICVPQSIDILCHGAIDTLAKHWKSVGQNSWRPWQKKKNTNTLYMGFWGLPRGTFHLLVRLLVKTECSLVKCHLLPVIWQSLVNQPRVCWELTSTLKFHLSVVESEFWEVQSPFLLVSQIFADWITQLVLGELPHIQSEIWHLA